MNRHPSFPITDIQAIPATLRNIQRSLRLIVMHLQAMILTNIFSSTLPCDKIPHTTHLPIKLYDTNTAILDLDNNTHITNTRTHTFIKQRHPSYHTILYPLLHVSCFTFGSYHRKIVIYLYACFHQSNVYCICDIKIG